MENCVLSYIKLIDRDLVIDESYPKILSSTVFEFINELNHTINKYYVYSQSSLDHIILSENIGCILYPCIKNTNPYDITQLKQTFPEHIFSDMIKTIIFSIKNRIIEYIYFIIHRLIIMTIIIAKSYKTKLKNEYVSKCTEIIKIKHQHLLPYIKYEEIIIEI